MTTETDKQIAERVLNTFDHAPWDLHDLASRLLTSDAKLSTCMEEIVSLSAEVVSLRNKLNEPVGDITRYMADLGVERTEVVKYQDHIQAMRARDGVDKKQIQRIRRGESWKNAAAPKPE